MKYCSYCNEEFIPKSRRYTLCSISCYRKFLIAEGASRSKILYLKGEENPRWKNGGAQRLSERKEFARTVRCKVLERDSYTCQICDKYSGNLHIDHIKSWAENPELRFDLDNCRTVCVACHYYLTFKRKMPANSKWGLKRLGTN